MSFNTSPIKTVIRKLPVDIETPISVYLKLRGMGPSSLLYSIEGEERISRYSYIGIMSHSCYVFNENEVVITDSHGVKNKITEPNLDPSHYLEEIL